MNKFLPQTGGHPLKLDDLVLMENSYLSGFSALINAVSGTGNGILSGVVITSDGTNINYTSGYVAIAGEIFIVSAGSFLQSVNPADVIYFNPVQTVIAPSPVTYEDQGSKNVHFQRTVVLKYQAVGDSGGATLAQMSSPDAGKILDWLPPSLTTVNDFFDATGLGINQKTGWAICNGLNGTPDLRGFMVASATSSPSSGAAALSAAVSGITANLGDVAGANKIAIAQANLPVVNFPVNDAGHAHDEQVFTAVNGGGRGPAGYNLSHPAGTLNDFGPTGFLTAIAETGITVSSGGSGTLIENRPATFYAYKIIRIN